MGLPVSSSLKVWSRQPERIFVLNELNAVKTQERIERVCGIETG